MTRDPSLAIIGGGIVGLSTAMQLARQFPDLSLTLLEKENELASHQTGHNSGVIHSGIYYAPGSLKARLCVEGVKRLLAFADDNQIRYELCGKIIIATSEREVSALRTLFERGRANGVTGLERIDQKRIRELEPHAAGREGLYSPRTGIMDFRAAAIAMSRRFCDAGGVIRTQSKVLKIIREGDSYILETTSGEVRSKYLINCAGLHADKIARLAGVQTDLRIIPFRGEYCRVRKERKSLVKNLIYPVPLPELPFLGVHFTRTVDGVLEAGPNAVLALAREGYRRTQIHFGDAIEMAATGNFWKMAGKYWKTGIFESYRAMSRKAFARELQKLVPEIREGDLTEGPSGVRAQCVDGDGSLVNDFKILEAPHAIHVLNVPSPAATASLAIGEYLVGLAKKSFELKGREKATRSF